jgi:hypothetical protein
MPADNDGKLKVTFVAFDKMIDDVPPKRVAKDECDGRTLEFYVEEGTLLEEHDGHIVFQTGRTTYLTREVTVTGTKCEHRLQYLKFEGFLGAPGKGQSWKCSACGEEMWSPHGAENAVPFKDIDQSEFIMSPEEVI